MNTRDIEAFVAVVETGSIVGAAARLNLTQPGITRRVQALEQQLGRALLERHSKPFKPTAAGRDAYEHGRHMLKLVDDLKAQMAPDGPVCGEMRIGVTPHLSEVAMTAPLDRLRAAFPRLALRITTGWAEQLLEQVRRGEIDVAGLHLPEGMEPPSEFESHSLGLSPLVIVAAQSAALSSPTVLQCLAGKAWVLNPEGCGFRSLLRRRFETEHLLFIVGVEALSSELRLSLAARDVGISMATRAAVEVSSFKSQLKIIDVTDFRPLVRPWLVHRPSSGRLAEPTEHFLRVLSEASVGMPAD